MGTGNNKINFKKAGTTLCLLFNCYAFICFSQDSSVSFNRVFPEFVNESYSANSLFSHYYDEYFYLVGNTVISQGNSKINAPYVGKVDNSGNYVEQNIFTQDSVLFTLYDNSNYAALDSQIFLPVTINRIFKTHSKLQIGVLIFNITQRSFKLNLLDTLSEEELGWINVLVNEYDSTYYLYYYSKSDSFLNGELIGNYFKNIRKEYSLDGLEISSYVVGSEFKKKSPFSDGLIPHVELYQFSKNRMIVVKTDGTGSLNQYYLQFTSKKGEILWSKPLEELNSKIKFSRAPVAFDNQYIYAGFHRITLRRVDPPLNNKVFITKSAVFKFDTLGNLIDSLIIDTNDIETRFNYPLSLHIVSDKKMLLTGYDDTGWSAEKKSGFVEEINLKNFSLENSIKYRYNWEDTLECIPLGSFMKDDKILLYGYVNHVGGSGPFVFPWLALSDNDYCIMPDCTDTTLSISDDLGESLIQVFPNPFSEFVTVLSEENNDIHFIEVLKTSGQSVYSTDQIATTINLRHLNSGMYIMVLTMQDGHSEYRKIIKQ